MQIEVKNLNLHAKKQHKVDSIDFRPSLITFIDETLKSHMNMNFPVRKQRHNNHRDR